MGDIDETISEALEKARESRLNGAIAALVAVAATLMALNSVKDGNVVQAMQQAQANGVDAWAYYQAKGTKQNLAIAAREQIELMRDTTPTSGSPSTPRRKRSTRPRRRTSSARPRAFRSSTTSSTATTTSSTWPRRCCRSRSRCSA
jgi:hypothetical protein